MRKCLIAVFLVGYVATMGGCLEWFYGKTSPNEPSLAEKAQRVAESFGPLGMAISLAIGAGGAAFGTDRHVKHRKSHRENTILKQRVAALTPPTEAPKV